MENIRSIKIVHNGYKIEYAKTMEEVEAYINTVITPYKHLNPERICDKIVSRNDKKKQHTKLIRIRYSTIYEETFILDINYY